MIFDATHSVQLSGGAGNTTAGNREYAPVLARAAVAAGVTASSLGPIRSRKGLSDASNMLRLSWVEPLMETCLRLRTVVRESETCKSEVTPC